MNKMYLIDLVLVLLFFIIGVLSILIVIHAYLLSAVYLLIGLYFFPVKGKLIEWLLKSKEEIIDSTSSLVICGVILTQLLFPLHIQEEGPNPIYGLSILVHLTAFSLNAIKIGQYVVEMNKRCWLHIIAMVALLLSYHL